MDRLEIIETLKHFPDRLEAEVAGLPEPVLRYRPPEGGWSIKEVAGHLRDAAEVWYRRLYSVWSLTDPLFVSFDGEQYVIHRAYQERDLGQVIAELRQHRARTIELLAGAVDWTRLGQQPGVGRRSFKQFAEFLISHDEAHLTQIRSLREAQGATAAT